MRKLALGLVVAAVVFAVAAPAQALDCEGFTLDDGCLFTITGGDTSNPIDGYAVTNAAGVPLWDFVRDREAQAIGYPISQRWTDGPFTLQAFQKVILQWDPAKQRMNYYNTLDALANRYPHVQLPFVPPHQVLEEDAGATFGTIIRNHLALLDQNQAIKERFLREPDWLNLYGLPIRYEERAVDGHPAGVQLLRTQRTVFVVWNVPAAGVTVGRVNLQNVPDKIKKLTDVIIPDAAEILATMPGSNISSELTDLLPWISDGLTRIEQAIIDNLESIAASAPDLFNRLTTASTPPWFHNQPTLETVGATSALLAIIEFPWTNSRKDDGSPHLAHRLSSTSPATWPAYIREIMRKPWMHDGVSWDELYMIFSLDYMFRLHTTHPSSHFFQKSRQLDQALTDTFNMPFMDTIEGFELPVLNALFLRNQAPPRESRGLEYIETALATFQQHGGLRDDQALIYMYLLERYTDTRIDPLDLSKPWRILIEFTNPKLLPEILTTTALQSMLGVTMDKRAVVLPHSGEMLLVVFRPQGVSSHTMDVLEHSVRVVEDIVGRSMHRDTIALFVEDVYGNRLGTNAGRKISAVPQYLMEEPISDEARRILIHEIAHFYFDGLPPWRSEGAAVFVEVLAGYLSVDDLNQRSSWCPTRRIRDLDVADNPPEHYWCRYVLGAQLLLDIYNNVGSEAFQRGLSILALGTISRGFRSPAGIGELEYAFTAFRSWEDANIVRAIISRWYYGDSGA